MIFLSLMKNNQTKCGIIYGKIAIQACDVNRWLIVSGLKYSKRPFCSGKILVSVKVCSSTQLKLRFYLNKREIMIFVIKFRRNFGRNFVIFVKILLAWHILLLLFFHFTSAIMNKQPKAFVLKEPPRALN